MPATTTFVAFLRGINVGRAKPVAMSDLREVVESLGHESVRTVLRSGNVVFAGPRREPRALAAALEAAIEKRLGLKSGVVLRTAEELRKVVDANPIKEAADQGSSLHVMFLGEPLPRAVQREIEPGLFLPDVVRLAKREIYVWYRNGMSGSKTAEQLDRRVKVLATDRNWNTVTKLLELTREA
jgi:uncharacterized protein (DUF1697 family)